MKQSIENWYGSNRERFGGTRVELVDELTEDSGWAVDSTTGRVYRPDGRFRELVMFKFSDSGQEVSDFVAPKFVEKGTGVLLNLARETDAGEQYLIQAKPESGYMQATTTVQASRSNLESGKVPFSDLLGRDDLLDLEEVDMLEDLGLSHGKVNAYVRARLRSADTDALDFLGADDMRQRFRWSTKSEIQELQRNVSLSVSTHLSKWLGTFT